MSHEVSQTPQAKPGYALSAILMLELVVFLVASFALGLPVDRQTVPSYGLVCMGGFLVSLGAMFAASYTQDWRSYFLRWLLRFSMSFPWMGDRKMALVLSALCAFSGFVAIADGLGIRLV